jgi:hypothetical protein
VIDSNAVTVLEQLFVGDWRPTLTDVGQLLPGRLEARLLLWPDHRGAVGGIRSRPHTGRTTIPGSCEARHGRRRALGRIVARRLKPPAARAAELNCRQKAVSDTHKLKHPQFAPVEDSSPSGHVKLDNRGNAVWEWASDALSDGVPCPPAGLAVVDDTRPAAKLATINRVAARNGYNPYQDDVAERQPTERARKRDLRELSRWIQLRKQRGETTKF